MSIYNSYSSIVPSEMSNSELRGVCGDIQCAKMIGKDTVRVFLTSTGTEYDVPVSRHKDYQEAYKTETGGIKC